MLPIALLVLSKSSGSGNIIFPTSWPEGKGSLSGPLTFWYDLVASAHVGGKLLCLHKAPNVCGLKDLAYFQGKIILGMKETKREQSKRREEKLASALILASHWIGFKLGFANWVQGYGLMLFHYQPVSRCFSSWLPCSYQAGVETCSECTEQQVGAGGRADRHVGWLRQNYLDNVCWTVNKTNVHSAFCRGKALDCLKSLSHQPPPVYCMSTSFD